MIGLWLSPLGFLQVWASRLADLIVPDEHEVQFLLPCCHLLFRGVGAGDSMSGRTNSFPGLYSSV